MHTMKRGNGEDRHLWTVGYFEPHADGEEQFHTWIPLRDFKNQDDAARYVNYLNGGNGEIFMDNLGGKKTHRSNLSMPVR